MAGAGAGMGSAWIPLSVVLLSPWGPGSRTGSAMLGCTVDPPTDLGGEAIGLGVWGLSPVAVGHLATAQVSAG